MSRSPKSARPEIIFDGVKSFQRFHAELEIVLVNHTELACLEVIAKAKDHIVRMYLDMKMLITKIDLATINAKYQIKRKSAEEKNIAFDSGQMMRNLATKMVIKMITSRLEITRVEDAVTSGTEFDIFLKPTDTDKVSDCLDHESGEYFTKFDFELGFKPPRLKPYNILHHRIRKIKFEDLDKVEVIVPTSPRSVTKSVRFAFPLDERDAPLDTIVSDNEENNNESNGNLCLMLPGSESDLCEEDFDFDHKISSSVVEDETTSSSQLVSEPEPVVQLTQTSGHKRAVESPSSGTATSAATWTRRFLSLFPATPPRQVLAAEV